MSFFKKFFPILLVLSVISPYSVHNFSAETKPNQDKCESRPSDFYLSQALRLQTRAKQRLYYQDKKLALENLQDSIRFFEIYLSCIPKGSASSLTHLNMAFSYLELGDYKKSENQVRLALEQDPKNRDAIILKTKLLIRQQKLEKAEEFLESKMSSYPEDSDFLFLLASLNKELGNQNASILYFTSLHDSIKNRNGNPKYKIHALKNLADLYYSKADTKKALYFYQGYLILNPKDVDARFRLAQIFNLLGDFGASRKILQDIHEQNPGNKDVELLLAEMYFVESRITAYPFFKKLDEEGKIPKIHLANGLYAVLRRDWLFADGFLRTFIPKHKKRLAARLGWIDVLRARYEPNDLAVELKNVAEMAYGMRQFRLAYNLASELLVVQQKMSADPRVIAYTYWFLSNCMEQLNSPHRAILYSKKAIEISPQSEEKEKYQLHLGHILLEKNIGRANEALSIAEDVLRVNPKNPSAWYLKGYSLFYKKEYKKSISALDRALEEDSRNSGYYFFRGMVFEKMSKPEKMELDMRKSIELTPSNPAPYNFLGYYFADKGIRMDESKKLVSKAVDLEPDNGAYQDSLGWVYFQMGDTENALFHLYLAKQMFDDREIRDPTIYDHLGDVYYKKEEYPIARNYWRKALELTEEPESRKKIESKINGKTKEKKK